MMIITSAIAKRCVEVGGERPEQRRAVVLERRAYAWQKPKPVVQQDEEKGGDKKRRVLDSLFARTESCSPSG
jgi:hypothetical protein